MVEMMYAPLAAPQTDQPTPAWVTQVSDVLRRELTEVGIPPAEVVTEPIPFTKLYRFSVIAEGFDHLRPSERQGLVWRIADRVLGEKESLKISMILTLSPAELAGDE